MAGSSGERGSRGGWLSRVGWVVVPVLAAATIWLGIVAILGTSTPLEVTDGISMLPALHSGELVLLTGVSPSALRVGDIVAVRVPKADQLKYRYAPVIVHRVASLDLQGTQLMVQTQGDNHQAPEPFLVPASDVGGRLLVAIPYVGYPLLFAHSRPGEIAIGGLILLALLYAGLTSVADVVEGAEPASLQPDAVASLTLAIQEYGEHLRSHTKVVQELGGTTQALHEAASTQNDVLASLQEVLQAMRTDRPRPVSDLDLPPIGALVPPRVSDTPAAPLPSRRARKRGAPAPSVEAGELPSRRSRKRAARGRSSTLV